MKTIFDGSIALCCAPASAGEGAGGPLRPIALCSLRRSDIRQPNRIDSSHSRNATLFAPSSGCTEPSKSRIDIDVTPSESEGPGRIGEVGFMICASASRKVASTLFYVRHLQPCY